MPAATLQPHFASQGPPRWQPMVDGVLLRSAVPELARGVISAQALALVAELHRAFNARRLALLDARASRQARLDAGEQPDFLASTRAVREGEWRVGPIPADLQDRRVEITGPIDRKMIINALNSGARVFMADCEDSQTPTWEGLTLGQANLADAVRRTISYASPEGKQYQLVEKPAVLMVRPRGWHLPERHVLVDGEVVSGALFDFAVFLVNNAKELIARGSGPYFYLPKLESHLEARLWNDVFVLAQRRLGLPVGTIKATVLIETILGAFEMDEILYELREHIVGLNCGRWDYIFSVIKKMRAYSGRTMPDRAQVTMTTHFLRSYSQLLITTCHRRGAFAMGGMAAFIPIKADPTANERAIAAVRADKQREAGDGHDGTWVAHPGLVSVAMDIFDARLRELSQHAGREVTNQLGVLREDVRVSAADLLAVPQGTISRAGLASNISVGVRYLESWLRGVGCVPLFNLMEDAATAEISRAQVWQWIHHSASFTAGPEAGQPITIELVRRMIDEELSELSRTQGPEVFARGKFVQAATLFDQLVTNSTFEEFLTLPAYEQV